MGVIPVWLRTKSTIWIINHINIKGIENVNKGDVVALIGDFDLPSIATLLRLLEKGAIIVPLTIDTKKQHDYFLEQS